MLCWVLRAFVVLHFHSIRPSVTLIKVRGPARVIDYRFESVIYAGSAFVNNGIWSLHAQWSLILDGGERRSQLAGLSAGEAQRERERERERERLMKDGR